MINLVEKSLYSHFFIRANLFIFLFLWGLTYYNLKLILFPLLFFSVFALIKLIKNFKEIHFKLYFIFFLFVLHKVLGDLFTESFVLKDYVMLCFFFSFLIFSYYKKDFVFKNIKNLIFLFAIIIPIYLILEWTFGPTKFEFVMIDCNYGWFSQRKLAYFNAIDQNSFSFILPLLFQENSHFGMISVPIISYLTIYIFKSENLNYKLIIFYVVILFSFGTVVSTTYFAMLLVISLIGIFFFNTNKIQKFILLSLILYCFSSISTNYQCNTRFYDTMWEVKRNILASSKNYLVQIKPNIKETTKNQNEWSTKFIAKLYNAVDFVNSKSEIFYEDVIKKMSEKQEKEKNIDRNDFPTNLSTEVFLHSVDVFNKSVFDNFFGWGFYNYEDAFEEKKSTLNYRNIVGYLNKKDASGNLIKILVEYGIFSLFLVYLIIKFLSLNGISNENKIFFLSIVLTQLLRGAGYFNGGFIFAISIMIISVIINDKKIKNE